MKTYEVTLALTAYVRVDQGDEDAVGKLARDKIAAGPCLCVIEGAYSRTGHYVVKGMSAAVTEVRPFVGNRRVLVKEGEDATD
jgi:hypothetical protein